MRIIKTAKEESTQGTNRFRGTVTVPLSPQGHSSSAVTGSSVSNNAANSSSNNTPRFMRSSSFTSALSMASSATAKQSQRLATLFQDVKRRYHWKKQHHHHRLPQHRKGSSSSHAWHVDFPKRIVLGTAAVFLLLPLLLLGWRGNHDAVVESSQEQKIKQQFAGNSRRDVFPNWFADALPQSESNDENENLPESKDETESVGELHNHDKQTMTDHHNEALGVAPDQELSPMENLGFHNDTALDESLPLQQQQQQQQQIEQVEQPPNMEASNETSVDNFFSEDEPSDEAIPAKAAVPEETDVA